MVIVAVSTGCTMCPDPFDYSGPVPNGSAPQNDFCARSNGILPLNAAPQPWPLIVKDQGPESEEGQPTPAEPAVIAEYPDDSAESSGDIASSSDETSSPADTQSVLR
jgi:hypothetical protein